MVAAALLHDIVEDSDVTVASCVSASATGSPTWST